ncbi:MAG: hypothetical protein O8C62_11960 [Candidatus Methanoperedens sp.]|nr:hypothetical protein [Candidatus Methanoperedens sp.]
MTTRIWLSEIQFSDNSKIAIDKNDIVVLFGPNNAGKSASLKEAGTLLRTKNNKGKVLKDITIEKDGSETELISFLVMSLNLSFMKENPLNIFSNIFCPIDFGF